MLRSLPDPVVNAASFGFLHAMAGSCVRRGRFARRVGRDSSFAWDGPREGRIVRGSRADGESWPRPADPPGSRPAAPVEALSETAPTWSHSDAATGEGPAASRRPTRPETHRPGRGPFGGRPASQTQRRSSKRGPTRAARQQAKARPSGSAVGKSGGPRSTGRAQPAGADHARRSAATPDGARPTRRGEVTTECSVVHTTRWPAATTRCTRSASSWTGRVANPPTER